MSICALPDCFVSSMRIGSACALISSSLGFPLRYCRTLAAVMASPFRVIWTGPGPHCVSTTDPVTVEVADPDDPDDPDEEPDDDPDEVEPEPDEPSPEPLPPDPLPAAAEEEPVPVFEVPAAPDTTALGELEEPAANEPDVEVW